MITYPISPFTNRRISRGTRRAGVLAIGIIALGTTAACDPSGSPDAASGSSTTTHVEIAERPGPSTVAPDPTSPSTTVSVAPEPARSDGSSVDPPAARPARPTGVRDELVAIGDADIHIRCEGAGMSTIVLISGFEAGSDGWGEVQPILSEQTRVCSYDRPGTGTSGPPASTQTFRSQASDLHALLTIAGEPGPYVVVGHSFGGPEAIEFAVRHVDVVAALVLVDASPTDWPTALCAVANDGSDAATFILGMCAGWSDPSANAEQLDVFTAFGEMLDTPALGSLPLTVLTAVDRELPPGLDAAERRRLTEAWDRGQLQWAQLSSAGRLITVADSGHYIQLDHPTLVIDEIGRLLP